MGFEMSQDL